MKISFFFFLYGIGLLVAFFASRELQADNVREYEALFNLTVRLIRANL